MRLLALVLLVLAGCPASQRPCSEGTWIRLRGPCADGHGDCFNPVGKWKDGTQASKEDAVRCVGL